MRVLLAAMQCAKGDADGNLARHLAVLDAARTSGCDLAVFPEFSLTGSVDPSTYPDRLVTVEDPSVVALTQAARESGVAALIGIGERHDDGPFITQLHLTNGRVLGAQRKRHLGEGEEAFRASSETASFAQGSMRFGAIVCAESVVDDAWDQTVSAGAEVIFFCSAPGLNGRRRSEAEWRDGFDWWASEGLASARHHAERLGVWVAMATQAGSTADEDFPGIAALIDPTGSVVDRLPDWRAGSLVVDIPLSIEVEPIRRSIRVLVIDEFSRTLLTQFGDDTTGHRWWVPPGGGMESGEDDLACARRELREELGRHDLEIGPRIGVRGTTFLIEDRWYTQTERWYVARCAHFEVDPAVIQTVRDEGIRDIRWWSSDEIRAAGLDTGPRDLADLLDRICDGERPDPEGDLGR